MRYIWFFLKSFVEDLLDALWSESFFFSFGFLGENFLGAKFLIEFFFCFFVDCVIYYRNSFWKFLLKILDAFTFCNCSICALLFEEFCWRPFGSFLKWKFSFWIFLGKLFWWQNFFDRIFFFVFVDWVLYYRDFWVFVRFTSNSKKKNSKT